MKIGFLSLGCPKNLVDGEVMLGIARQAGHEITSEPASADVLVVNTCAFIDSAKQESIDAILEMAGQKRDGRCSRLVVTGCLAERYRHELQQEIPEIDAVLGTGEVPQILDAIGARDPQLAVRTSQLAARGSQPAGRGSQLEAAPQAALGQSSDIGGAQPITFYSRGSQLVAGATTSEPRAATTEALRAPSTERRTPALPTYLYDADTPRMLTTPKHFAYVKIAEGCDYTCAFCIIPSLRGAYRSRTGESIVREARMLADRGVRELLLVSQDTTFFGIDRGERGALARLLRELNAIDGLAWIRLLYLYPTTITDDVLDAVAGCEKVCRYIDLPLQHASASVLKRMRRPGNRRTYDALLTRIRERVPGVTLRTTLIVGFPGETDEDFAELEQFVEETRFNHLGVFTYSHEEGTRAYGLPDDVPGTLKRKRRNRLMARQNRIVSRAHKALVGDNAPVLIDGVSPEHDLVVQGRLEGQAPEIDSVVYLTGCDPSECRPGQLISARIVGARGYDLIAEPMA